MTHEQFLEWLDEEIEFCEPRAKSEQLQTVNQQNYWTSQINILRQVREKFLALTPPSTTLDK